MERVVITGMGIISPLGNRVEEFWSNLQSGKNGIGKLTAFDGTEFKASLAAQVNDFSPEQYIDKKEARRMDRFTQFAVASAVEAMEQAGLDMTAEDPFRAGVIFGSGIGGMSTFEEEHTKLLQKGPGRVSPFCIPLLISNMASASISIRYGFKGSTMSTVTACASSTHAIGEAMRAIRHGYLDIAIAGGAEATITPLSFAGFSNMMALSTSDDPDAASLPFDARRGGFVMGEGAATLVLESYRHAAVRGANILCEVGGYGSTSDAYHITSPDPDGEAAAYSMSMAVKDAGIDPSEVGYINAHGTGTPLNDKYETAAIKKAFGEHAYGLSVSSTKSMTGHLLGAAGAVEAIASALALRDGIVPPTINYKEKDPECDLDITPNKAAHKPLRAALSNSLGFGGHNATILLRRVD